MLTHFRQTHPVPQERKKCPQSPDDPVANEKEDEKERRI
jgi:hypothetical protein